MVQSIRYMIFLRTFLHQVHRGTRVLITMQHCPAAERNKDYILEVLKKHFAEDSVFRALEIGSGTGQHVVHFAQAFPKSSWQPTDTDQRLMSSTTGHIKNTCVRNVKQPIYLDASLPPEQWPSIEPCDLIIIINVSHITHFSVTKGFIQGSSKVLKPKGIVMVYGPFAVNGVITPDSNVQFDAYLRARSSSWGLRDVSDLSKIAEENGLDFVKMYDMPANNKTLIFFKID